MSLLGAIYYIINAKMKVEFGSVYHHGKNKTKKILTNSIIKTSTTLSCNWKMYFFRPCLMLVAHTCNPNYSGAGVRRIAF
jgi:hypothetical protein